MAQPKAAFFDWDGTLSYDGTHVAEGTAEAIRAFRQAGNFACLCTGRSLAMIPDEAMALGWDGLIGGAGAYIRVAEPRQTLERRTDGELLFRHILTEPLVEELVNFFLHGAESALLEGERRCIGIGCNGPFPDSRVVSLEQFRRDFGQEPISKFTGYITDSTAFAAQFGTRLRVVQHPNYMEGLLPECSKADGIRQLEPVWGVLREDTIAFGDSANDLDMLRYAGTGVAMGNYTEETVREAADKLADTCRDGGVPKTLREWL